MFWKGKRIYLDRAAGVAGNPSSPHEEGREARKMLEDARTTIARLTEVQSNDVIFTSGATEANALAILGHVRALRQRAGRDAVGRNNMHVLYLPTSHASIVENVALLAEEGVRVEELPILDSRIDTKTLAGMLRPETVLISMDAVCGETGIIWNTREVAQLLRTQKQKEGRPILHVDASQAPLTEKITRAHFDADMMTLDASKVGSVRGIGALIAHCTIPLVALYRGGGQERGLRPGSEAPELARDFAKALSAVARKRVSFRSVAEAQRTKLVSAISKAIPNVEIHEGRTQAPHILNVSFNGCDTDYLVALLDEAGFAVATRSACETDNEKGSRAVLALTGNAKSASVTLRVSWGEKTDTQDMRFFVKTLAQAVLFSTEAKVSAERIDKGGRG